MREGSHLRGLWGWSTPGHPILMTPTAVFLLDTLIARRRRIPYVTKDNMRVTLGNSEQLGAVGGKLCSIKRRFPHRR